MRTTFPIAVSFGEGEQPTARKLTSIATQSKNGLALIERAVGDLFNQSGDSTTSDYPLRIVNLARVIGDQALMKGQFPRIDNHDGVSIRIKQPIAAFLGMSEIALDFIPSNDSVLVSSVNALKHDGNAVYTGSSVATADLVDTDTEWFLDTSKSTIHLGRALKSTQDVDHIEYSVTFANLPSDSSQSTGFSYIPDDQDEFQGLKICKISANVYNIVLPFRCPINDIDSNSKTPRGVNNRADITQPTLFRYWGPVEEDYVFTTGISDRRLYRYSPPQIIIDMFDGSGAAGDTIPGGLLYLWDDTNETVVEGVTFKIPTVPLGVWGAQFPFILQLEGPTLDGVFDGLTSSSATDAVLDYKGRYSLICVGSSISEAIFDLRKELSRGNHATGAKRRISHGDLIKTQPVTSARHLTNVPASFVDGDDHPHLLSRLGSKSSAPAQRDRFNNGMLGDLLILSSVNNNDNFQNITSNSNKIIFGDMSTGPSLRYVAGTVSHVASNAPSTAKATGVLSSDKSALRAESTVILFGTELTNSLDYDDSDRIFRFAANNDVQDSTIAAGSLLIPALETLVSSANGRDEIIASSTYLMLHSKSISGVFNNLLFKGQDLNLSADDSDTTSEVVIGNSNTSTHFRVKNNELYFGTISDNDSLKFDDTTNIFTFRADGSNNTSHIDNSTVRAGKFIATDVGQASTFVDIDASGDITANNFFRDASEPSTITIPIVPGFFDDTVSVVFDQIGSTIGTGAGPEFVWNFGASYDEDEIFWMAIPFVPHRATITTIKLFGVYVDTGAGSGTHTSFQAKLADEASQLFVPVVGAALGTSGNKTLTFTIPSGHVYTGGVLNLVIGLKETGGGSGSIAGFRFTNASITYTYTELAL